MAVDANDFFWLPGVSVIAAIWAWAYKVVLDAGDPRSLSAAYLIAYGFGVVVFALASLYLGAAISYR